MKIKPEYNNAQKLYIYRKIYYPCRKMPCVSLYRWIANLLAVCRWDNCFRTHIYCCITTINSLSILCGTLVHISVKINPEATVILVPFNLILNTDGKHISYIGNMVLNQYKFSINVKIKSIGNILSIHIIYGVATSPNDVSTAYPIRYVPGLFLRCVVVFIMTVLMGFLFTYPIFTPGRLHWHRCNRSVAVNQPWTWTLRIKWMTLNTAQQTVNGVHPMMIYCQFYPLFQTK